MLPIIRRRREPLLPLDPPRPTPACPAPASGAASPSSPDANSIPSNLKSSLVISGHLADPKPKVLSDTFPACDLSIRSDTGQSSLGVQFELRCTWVRFGAFWCALHCRTITKNRKPVQFRSETARFRLQPSTLNSPPSTTLVHPARRASSRLPTLRSKSIPVARLCTTLENFSLWPHYLAAALRACPSSLPRTPRSRPKLATWKPRQPWIKWLENCCFCAGERSFQSLTRTCYCFIN